MDAIPTSRFAQHVWGQPHSNIMVWGWAARWALSDTIVFLESALQTANLLGTGTIQQYFSEREVQGEPSSGKEPSFIFVIFK